MTFRMLSRHVGVTIGMVAAFGSYVTPCLVTAAEDPVVDVFVNALKQPSPVESAFYEELGKVRQEREARRFQMALERATRLRASIVREPELLSTVEIEIGSLYVELGKFPEAKQHFEEALQIEEGRSASGIERFEPALMWLAGVEIELGELKRAEDHYIRLLRLKRDAYGKLHYRVIGQLRALAHLSLRQGGLSQAEAYVREEIEIWNTKPTEFGVPVGDSAVALLNLGAVQARQGKLDDAIDSHLRSRELLLATVENAIERDVVPPGAFRIAIACEDRLIALYRLKGYSRKIPTHLRYREKLQALLADAPEYGSYALWYQSLLPLP